MEINFKSTKKRQIIDITDDIAKSISSFSGLVNVFIKHTTASLTTADLDPGTDLDLLDFLASLVPDLNWRHPHNPKHAPDHLLASVIGSAVSIPVINGELQLGTWQRIVLIELDGPRERNVMLTIIDG
jgi:secondary thiamine-phosphate synthase enzyme